MYSQHGRETPPHQFLSWAGCVKQEVRFHHLTQGGARDVATRCHALEGNDMVDVAFVTHGRCGYFWTCLTETEHGKKMEAPSKEHSLSHFGYQHLINRGSNLH